MKFFSEAALEGYRGVTGQIDWSRVWRDYDAHIATLWMVLSPGWRELAKAELHDARLVRVDRPKKSELVLQLDAIRLEFRGVSHLRIPSHFQEAYWVYSEISQGKTGDVVIEIRFSSADAVIAARDVSLIPRVCNAERP